MPPPTVLIEQRAIAARIREMATELRAAIPNDDIHFVCVLKGAFMFLSDLMRAFDDRVTLDFIAVSSYGASTKSSGEVRLVKDVDTSLADRHVVIVEDIVDTGLTLHYLQDILRRRGPASLRTACLLSKPSRRQVDVTVDFIGFTIDDQFVVGYGLDYPSSTATCPTSGSWRPDAIRVTGPPSGPGRRGASVLQDLCFVEGADFAVSHQHPAVHDRRDDVVAMGGVDEV